MHNIRYPRNGRKNFKIYFQTKFEGKTKSDTIENEALASINAQLSKKLISIESAEKMVKELVDSLNKKPVVIFNNENLDIVNAYWEAKYKRKRIKDKETARYKCNRAIRALGKLSIQVASAEQIQDAIDAKFEGNPHREIIIKLRSILRWLKRDITLLTDAESNPNVKFVTESEFNLMLKYISNPVQKLLCQVCFYTGARIGEAFAFELRALNEIQSNVLIKVQIDKFGDVKPTKNNKERRTFIWPQGIEYFKQWVEVKKEISSATRNAMSKIVKNACYEAFPGNPAKHLKFHDLRHSYAISLIDKGVGLTHVAQCIGDGVKVTETYYVGFVLTTDSLDLIKKIIQK